MYGVTGDVEDNDAYFSETEWYIIIWHVSDFKSDLNQLKCIIIGNTDWSKNSLTYIFYEFLNKIFKIQETRYVTKKKIVKNKIKLDEINFPKLNSISSKSVSDFKPTKENSYRKGYNQLYL